MVAIESDALLVAQQLWFDGPIGSPHETVHAEGIAQTSDHCGHIGIRVGLSGEGPRVGDFDVEVWIAGEGLQELKALRVVDGAVGHVVDDCGETGELVQ